MVRRFKYRRIVQPAVVWITLQAAIIGTAHADLIDTLCDASTDPTTVIGALVGSVLASHKVSIRSAWAVPTMAA